MKNITYEDIRKYSEKYNQDIKNKDTEKKIKELGITKTCLNEEIIKENEFRFNIELPEGHRYNQNENNYCWMYAGFSMIQYNIASNLNMNVKDFVLSNNYLSFYDKLEKSNSIYEKIIHLNTTDIDKVIKNMDYLINQGYYEIFVRLVNKYGLVPEEAMPAVYENFDSNSICQIFNEKITRDIYEILDLKRKNVSSYQLEKQKNNYMEENYILLSKVFGEPIQKFDYTYRTKDGKEVTLKDITPLEFKRKYLTLNLGDFVTIGNIPKYNKFYYKKYAQTFWGVSFEFLNLPIDELKELTLKQLKDNNPVYTGLYVFRYRDFSSGVLDTRVYDYDKILGITRLEKEKLLDFAHISLHHFVVIEGVNIQDDKIQRWKIEDNFGNDFFHDGYCIMNDNFFNEHVLCVVIDKKYLSKEQLSLLQEKAISYKDSIF